MSVHGPILTQRDVALLLGIYKHRYLSVSQIEQLHFPSKQTTYRRLRALAALGYIKSFLPPNIPEHIYHLDQHGAEFVAETLGVAVVDLKWHRTSRAPKDYYFLQHFLKITDFRIALALACQSSAISLVGFVPEFYAEKVGPNGVTKYIKDIVCDMRDQAQSISHTPDAVFSLSKNQTSALFFLEIDCGTEVISDEHKGVLKSVRFYLNYLISGQYQRYQEDFGCPPFKGFRALLVTTSEARVEHMRQVISQIPTVEKAKKFIWLTDEGKVTAATMFQPIWLTADVNDSTLYRIG